MNRLLAAFFAAMVGSLTPLCADTIAYDSGHATGFNVPAGLYSSELHSRIVKDVFTLQSDTTLTSVIFEMGVTTGSTLGDFNFGLYLPTTLPHADDNVAAFFGETITSANYSVLSIADQFWDGAGYRPWQWQGSLYTIQFSLSNPIFLEAGSYRLSFFGLGDTDFRAANTGHGDGFTQYAYGNGFQSFAQGSLPFELLTDDNGSGSQTTRVADPANTVLLFLVGLASLIVAGVRRGRSV